MGWWIFQSKEGRLDDRIVNLQIKISKLQEDLANWKRRLRVAKDGIVTCESRLWRDKDMKSHDKCIAKETAEIEICEKKINNINGTLSILKEKLDKKKEEREEFLNQAKLAA